MIHETPEGETTIYVMVYSNKAQSLDPQAQQHMNAHETSAGTAGQESSQRRQDREHMKPVVPSSTSNSSILSLS
jgi:hypothetical protein